MAAGEQNQQERLYFLLNQLQKMCREVPGNLQQRLPYELLSELAASLAQVSSFIMIVKDASYPARVTISSVVYSA